MNPASELANQPVLVHPALAHDPAGKAGQVGIITAADLVNDMIHVNFGDKGQGLYGTDALLQLQPHEDIKQNLEQHKDHLSKEDFKALFQISLLQEFKQSVANTKTAMSLALQSDAVRDLSMRSVEDALGLKRNPYVAR